MLLRKKTVRRAVREVLNRYIPLDGGLNMVDAPLSVKEGMLIGASNYEQRVRGGYRRIEGHERFDGRDSPSDANYWILNFDAGTAIINSGDTVTGATSAATGVALSDAVIETGSYATNDATGYLVLARLNGAFIDNENLQVAAATKSVSNGIAGLNNANTDELNNTYQQAAIEDLRALIEVVGLSDGSGRVRGVHVFSNGDVYAWRDNTNNTACLMWKATTAGWVQQSLGFRLIFTSGGGAYTPVEGDVITGATSGATATLTRIVLQSGNMVGGTAAGYFVFASQTGTFQSENLDVGGNLNVATISADSVANAIAPGGQYEVINHNFYGNASTKRMYGVNGVDYMFEYDGSVYVPLITGNTIDKPKHIAQYKFHLFFSIGSSLQNSATGDPYVYSGSGANEIGTGDDIVGIREEIGNSLAILSRNKTKMLYGSDSTDFDLRTLSEEAGGIEWTMQRIGEMRYMDDRGFTTLNSVQAYGDFKDNVFSQVIEPLIDENKEKVTASSISRTKNQYRVFFNDGTGIYATFDNKKIKGFMPVSFTGSDGAALVVRCTANGENAAGSEVSYFGSDDGYVYQMDKGTSFDGEKVEAFIVLSFLHFRSPETIKEFLKLVLEVSAKSSINLSMTPSFDYDAREDSQQTLTVQASGGRWNVANWNEFLWSSPGVGNPEAYINGSGKNISVLIFSEDAYAKPHIIHGFTFHYMFRRRSR